MNKLINVLIYGVIIFISVPNVFGQENSIDQKNSKKEKINQSYTFIKVRPDANINSTDAKMWLSNALNCRTEDVLEESRRYNDKLGQTHIRFKQYYKGILVFPAEYIIHAQDGKIISANGDFYENLSVPTNPTINPEKAKEISIQNIQSEELMNGKIPLPQLIIYAFNSDVRLAYITEVYSKKPFAHFNIYLDAMTGEVFQKENLNKEVDVQGTAVTHYSGTKTITTNQQSPGTYVLQESGRNISTMTMDHSSDFYDAVEIYNGSNSWNTSSELDYGTDVHFGLEATYDYFLNTYGYNSYDSSGHPINAYINFGNNYNNAFWDGSHLAFGDGDQISYRSFASLDVVGHEFTHAVTDYSAGLIGLFEPGALNESFSDIFGVTINFLYNPAIANYLVGSAFSISGLPFRSMSNPKNCAHPNTYHGEFWDYNGGGFFGGGEVHIDAGPSNYCFYLLAEGGYGINDNGDNYFVNAIGRTKAAAIAFRALTVYFTSSTGYSDARNAEIQAAIDLYGNCSNEVIQVTNAWHAVGVGQKFTTAVVAGFTASGTSFCQAPVQIQFNNVSTNATSYTWNFGDGNQSAALSPAHIYAAPGNYIVQLTVTGNSACNTSSSVSLPVSINSSGPASPSCIPATQSACCVAGIFSIKLNDLYNVSGSSTEGYVDFSCDHTGHLIAGESYPIKIYTGRYQNENVRAWIDYNNDNIFDQSELLFDSQNKLRLHEGQVIVVANAIFNTKLRMRIISDLGYYNPSSPCSDPISGQAEDYSVIITPNILPPVADFIADTLNILPGQEVHFTDISQHAPITRHWDFFGGQADTSDLIHPTVTYLNAGSYTVKLVVVNANGADSITKISYINVSEKYRLCEGLLSSSAVSGEVENIRGTNGLCNFIIAPPCIADLIITVDHFNFPFNSSYLKIYDGVNASGLLLFSATGTIVPPNPFIAHSGKAYIVYQNPYTDTSIYFHITWSSNIPTTSINVPQFYVSNTNVQFNNIVFFGDISPNSVSRQWDFGDGSGSLDQTPSHLYSQPGTYLVKLFVQTCQGRDTLSRLVNVQGTCNPVITPTAINVTLQCGDSIQVPISISNSGTGDMTAELFSLKENNKLRILVLALGARLQDEVPNALNAARLISDISPVIYQGSDPNALSVLLNNADVILVPGNYLDRPFLYEKLAPVIRMFVERGGGIVFLNGSSDYCGNFHSLGLIHPIKYNGASGAAGVVNVQHPLLNNVPPTFNLPSNTHCLSFQTGEMIPLITKGVLEVLSYNYIGEGRIVFLAFDFYNINSVDPVFGRILFNALEWSANKFNGTDSLSINSPILHLQPGDSISTTITIYANESGTTNEKIIVRTNQPSEDTISINVTVTGNSSLQLLANCIHFNSTGQYSSSTDTLYFINNGCGRLSVDSALIQQGEFELKYFSRTILPGDTGKIIVVFKPVTVGFISTSLQLFYNGQSASFCADGSSIAAPLLSISADSIILQTNCQQMLQFSEVLSNTGAGNLLVRTNHHFKDPDTIRVVLTTGNLNSIITNRMDSLIRASCPECIITQSSMNEYYLNQVLPQADLLLISPTSITGSSGISPVVTNFVKNGGTVFYWGIPNPLFYFTGNNLLEALVHGTNDGDTAVVVDPSFPAMNNIGPLIITTPNTYVTNLINPPVHKLIDLKGFDYCSYATSGKGMIYYLANLFWKPNQEELKILPGLIKTFRASRLPKWISISDSLSIAGATNITYPITFNLSGLNAGQYSGDIIFRSSSPVYKFDTIHCQINISGNENITLNSNQINFPNTFVGGTSARNLTIINTGCDTLFIDSVIGAHSSVSGVNSFILTGDTMILTVTMTSFGVGTLTDTLKIYNSDNDTIVLLTMNGITPPVSVVNSHSLQFTLNCGDSLNSFIQLNNTGLSPFIFTSNHLPNTDSIQVLTLSSLNQLYYNSSISLLLQPFTENTVFSFVNNIHPDTVKKQLLYKDVLIVNWQYYYAPGDYFALTSIIRDYAEHGGNVIFTLAGLSNDTILYSTGLLNPVFDNNSGPFNASVQGHPILKNIQLPVMFGYHNSRSAYFNDPGFVNVCSNDTSSLAGFRNINNGKAIFIGNDNLNNTITQQLISNSINWCGSLTHGSWLHVMPPSNSVGAQTSLNIPMSVNASGLVAGDYTTNIIIESNDPLLPFDTILVSLHVSGNSIFNLIDSCLDMGIIQSNANNETTFNFYNSGCDTLQMQSVTGMPSGMSVTYSHTRVLPGDTAQLTLHFHPAAVMTYSGNIVFHTNSGNYTVCYSAISSPPPVYSSTVSQLQLNVTCGGSLQVPITIHNNGGSNLHMTNISTGSASTTKLLFLTYGVDSITLANFIAEVQSNNSTLHIRFLNTTDTTVLKQNLHVDEIVCVFQTISANSIILFNHQIVFDRFLRKGGQAIIFGGVNNSSNFYTSYLSSDYDTDVGGALAYVDVLGHPLVDSLPSNFPMSGNPNTKIDPYFDEVIDDDYYSGAVVGYENILLGKAVYLGFDYSNFNFYEFKVFMNAVYWLDESLTRQIILDQQQILVSPLDSEIINVSVSIPSNASGVIHDTLIFQTNDPLHSIVTIPVTINILNQSYLTIVDSCLDFGTVQQYATANLSTTLSNTGCATLNTSSIQSMSGLFNSSTQSYIILPDSGKTLNVAFQSSVIGDISDTLIINGNFGLYKLCVHANVVGSPTISVSPINFSVNLNCNDTVTVDLLINNSGSADLAVGSNTYTSGDNIIRVACLNDNYANIQNYINPGNYTFTNYYFSQLDNSSLKNILYRSDIVFLNPSGYLNYSLDSSLFQDFVKDGGTVVFLSENYYHPIDAFGLFHGSLITSVNCNADIVLPNHPLVNGINSPLSFNWTTTYTFNDPGNLKIVDNASGDALTFRNSGFGKVIYCGVRITGDPVTTKLLNNMIYWAGKESHRRRIIVQDNFMTITPATTDTMQLYINAATLSTGIYHDTLILLTNDPQSTELKIPVTLNVTGAMGYSLSSSCLNFYTVTDDSGLAVLTMTNTGCQPFNITGITFNSSSYKADFNTSIILPGGSQDIQTTFYLSPPGIHLDSMTVNTTAGDTNICLIANCSVPFINTNPDSIVLTLGLCHDSVTVPIAINNQGGASLNATINSGGDDIEILMLNIGADIGNEYSNTISEIRNQISNVQISEFNLIDTALLRLALHGRDVLIVPEPENGNPGDFIPMSNVLNDFAASGGTVILCGTNSMNGQYIFNTGLFHGSYGGNVCGLPVNVLLAGDALANNVQGSFIAPSGCYALNFSDTDRVVVMESGNLDIVSYRNIGLGMAAFVAFDFYSPTSQSSVILANAIGVISSQNHHDWLYINPDSLNLLSNSQGLINITFSTTSLLFGNHTDTLIINSNDPLNPTDTIICRLIVNNNLCSDFVYANGCNGIIYFTDSSANNPTNYYWDFGDGITSTLENPVHQYLSPGTYNVLHVSSNGTDIDTIQYTLTPYYQPAVQINYTGLVVPQSPINFSPGNISASNYFWNFGDGFLSSDMTPYHSYASEGIYKVILQVTDSFGCITSDTLKLGIIGLSVSENEKSGIWFYPNPFHGSGTLEYKVNDRTNVDITIYDLMGKIISEPVDKIHSPGNYSLIIPSTGKGVYFIEIKTEKFATILKIISLD